MTKSTFQLPAYIVMPSPTLLGCNSRINNDLNLQENTLITNKDIHYANQVYLDDIQYYRKETGKKKWEFFKAEYTSRLDELSKEFAGFSNSN